MNECYALNDTAWEEWEEFRRVELKKKIGTIAKRKQVEFLCQYPTNLQQDVINQSIMNSWQGLFAPKQQQQRQVAETSSRSRPIMEELSDRSWAM